MQSIIKNCITQAFPGIRTVNTVDFYYFLTILQVEMVRNYKKKTTSNINEEDVKNAMLQVLNKTMTLRGAAKAYNMRANTLFYRLKNYKNSSKLKSQECSSKFTVNQVFTNAEEEMLENYLLKSSKMNYGLTYQHARMLAYEYAVALNKCPSKWVNNHVAGVDWMEGFTKRHQKLSFRKSENMSLFRSTSFNKHDITEFQNNYEEALREFPFTPDRIYNLDETRIPIIVQAPNDTARTSQKQVSQSVSAEITMCAIVNAAGSLIPPVFIFPTARFHDSMLTGAPNGSIGFANSPTSGSMIGKLFLEVLEHVKKVTRCSKNDMILLLLDNHESHCTINATKFCHENGIILVTFPPSCTHRLQPLDVAVIRPFKERLSVAQNDWLLNYPLRKTIAIHDFLSIITPVYKAAFTLSNITSGFSEPGIYPFNRNAFTDEDFQYAEVTNRSPKSTSTESIFPIDQESNADINELTLMIVDISPPIEIEIVESNFTESATMNPDFSDVMLLEIVRPFPKAAPRKERPREKKKRKSCILGCCEKKKIEEAKHSKRQKVDLQKSREKLCFTKEQATSSKKVNDNSDLDFTNGDQQMFSTPILQTELNHDNLRPADETEDSSLWRAPTAENENATTTVENENATSMDDFVYVDINQQSSPYNSQVIDYWEKRPVNMGQDPIEFTMQTDETHQPQRNVNFRNARPNETGPPPLAPCRNVNVISKNATAPAIDFPAQLKTNDTSNAELTFFQSLIPDIMKLSGKRRRQFKEAVMSTLNKFLDEEESACATKT